MIFFYDPLWEYLNLNNISKSKFKELCGISNTTVSKLTNNKNVSLEVISKICDGLHCSIDNVLIQARKGNMNSLFFNPKYQINTSLNTISLFSGAGGLDLGLINAGFNIVFANDIYKPAIENYSYNIGDIDSRDIRDIDANELPSADVVIGGFPCQPFSSAGNRLGTDDDRGNLYLDVIRVIRSKKPKVVIMENVRGLLSMKNKDGSKLIDSIVYLLQNVEPGYKVTYKLVKASNYGVPQNRFRVLIIGFRSDLNIDDYKFPEPIKTDPKKLTVGYALKGITSKTPNADEVWKLSPQSQKLVDHIPEGGSWKNIPYEALPPRLKRIRDNMKKYHSPNFYRRYARTEINGTITAAATPENSGIINPTHNRRYSVREVARIQSFPDDYVFVGSSIPSKYKVIGNAVPPKLAHVIGDSIVRCLSEHKI